MECEQIDLLFSFHEMDGSAAEEMGYFVNARFTRRDLSSLHCSYSPIRASSCRIFLRTHPLRIGGSRSLPRKRRGFEPRSEARWNSLEVRDSREP